MPSLYNCILNSGGQGLLCFYCPRAQHENAHSKVKIFCTSKSIFHLMIARAQEFIGDKNLNFNTLNYSSEETLITCSF